MTVAGWFDAQLVLAAQGPPPCSWLWSQGQSHASSEEAAERNGISPRDMPNTGT